MRKTKRTVEKPPAFALRPWHLAVALPAVFIALVIAYSPAIRGQFVYDDLYLPFTEQEFEAAPLKVWIAGLRPFLMFSFWLNFRISELDPFSYHLTNVVLHFGVGLLVFFIARRLLERTGSEGLPRDLLASFAGALFLVHPLQTESVAYVASRSEVLSVLFCYGALALFLYRRSERVTWPVAIAIVVLFGAAVSTKEHTAVLPLVLLLTDYYFNPGFSFRGVLRNWKLYVLFAAGAALAARWLLITLRASNATAGFGVREFTWYEYFFTQCRAIWTYLRMFVLPYGQNVDHDYAVSRTILQHGAIIGLVALVAAAAAAFVLRRRYPLASYGFFVFLIFVAPTSSVVPILDVVAERRVYLPMIGLLLMTVDLLRRWKVSRPALVAALGAVLIVEGALALNRNERWATAKALWTDAVEKSPRKFRPQFQLGYAYYSEGRCNAALGHYQVAAQYTKPDYGLLTDMALAYDCVRRYDEAIQALQKAAAVAPRAHAYALMGMVYAHAGKNRDAVEVLNTAMKVDPSYPTTYVYLAAVHAALNDLPAAVADYQRALALNPADEAARSGLAIVEARLKGR